MCTCRACTYTLSSIQVLLRYNSWTYICKALETYIVLLPRRASPTGVVTCIKRYQIILNLVNRILECSVSIASKSETCIHNFLMLRIDDRPKNYFQLTSSGNGYRQTTPYLNCPISCIDKPALWIGYVLIIDERRIKTCDQGVYVFSVIYYKCCSSWHVVHCLIIDPIFSFNSYIFITLIHSAISNSW